jgi:hypothetical protein
MDLVSTVHQPAAIITALQQRQQQHAGVIADTATEPGYMVGCNGYSWQAHSSSAPLSQVLVGVTLAPVALLNRIHCTRYACLLVVH